MSQNATEQGHATDGVVVSRTFDITPQEPEMADRKPHITMDLEDIGQPLVFESLDHYRDDPESLGRALIDMLEDCEWLVGDERSERVFVGLKLYTKEEVDELPEHPGW